MAWRRRGLAVLALSFAAQAQDLQELSPCLGFSWPADLPLSEAGQWRVFKISDARSCLDSFKMHLHDMVVTLENLLFGVNTIYSFSPIAQDSLASRQKNRCGLGVHAVRVPLAEELLEVWRDKVLPAARAVGLNDGRTTELQDPTLLKQLLLAETTVSTLDFHCTLNKLFNQLNDGHTVYMKRTAIAQVLPVMFYLEARTPGSKDFRIMAEPAQDVVTNLNLAEHTQVLTDQSRREVLLINGKDPLEFLQGLADRRGVYHDAGQRLNAFLLSSTLTEDLDLGLGPSVSSMACGNSDLLLPTEASVTITFQAPEGGSDEVVDWVLLMNPQTVTKSLVSQNPYYSFLQEMEEKRATWMSLMDKECSLISGCIEVFGEMVNKSTPAPQATAGYRRLLEAVASSPSEEVLHSTAVGVGRALRERHESRFGSVEAAEDSPRPRPVRSLQEESADSSADLGASPQHSQDRIQACLNSSATDSSPAPELIYTGEDSDGSEFVTVMGMGDMVVFKLTSFMASDTLLSLQMALEAYRAAVDYARAKNIHRVLVDIVSNGGGLVFLSDLLRSLFMKDYDPRSHCLDYNHQINEYWRQWILSYGQGIEAATAIHQKTLAAQLKGVPVDVARWAVKWKLEYLKGVLQTSNRLLGHNNNCFKDSEVLPECKGTYLVETSQITRSLSKVDNSTSVDELLSLVDDALANNVFVPSALYGSDPFAPTDKTGWFPFLGNDVLDRATMAPFKDLSGILNPVSQQWGGIRANYSRKGVLDECAATGVASLEVLGVIANSGLPDLSAHRDHPFTDVAVLTDGLAGSAASAFPSGLMASGYATLFSYGGRGEVMDTTGFAGGNVEEYAKWWPKVVVAAELGMWLLPDSSWERLSRSRNFTDRDVAGTESVIYPAAMPSQGATVSFNFLMMYIPQFGVQKDRSVLPREWYRLPAHKHYHRWPRSLSQTCGNPTALVDLYRQIQSEDWCAVRLHPEYLGQGWAPECVPPPAKCQCCETKLNPSDLAPATHHHRYAMLAAGLVSVLGLGVGVFCFRGPKLAWLREHIHCHLPEGLHLPHLPESLHLPHLHGLHHRTHWGDSDGEDGSSSEDAESPARRL